LGADSNALRERARPREHQGKTPTVGSSVVCLAVWSCPMSFEENQNHTRTDTRSKLWVSAGAASRRCARLPPEKPVHMCGRRAARRGPKVLHRVKYRRKNGERMAGSLMRSRANHQNGQAPEKGPPYGASFSILKVLNKLRWGA